MLSYSSFFKSDNDFLTADYDLEGEDRIFLNGMSLYAEGDIVLLGGQKDYSDGRIPAIAFCHSEADLSLDALQRIVYNDFINQNAEKSVKEHGYCLPQTLSDYSLLYYLYPSNDPSFESYLSGGLMVWQRLNDSDANQNHFGIGTNLIPVVNGYSSYDFAKIKQCVNVRCNIINHTIPEEDWDTDIRNADNLSTKDVSQIAAPERTFSEFEGESMTWKDDNALLQDVILPWSCHFSQDAGKDIRLSFSLQATFHGLDTGEVEIELSGQEYNPSLE